MEKGGGVCAERDVTQEESREQMCRWVKKGNLSVT